MTIKQFIDNSISRSQDRSKVTVFPLMCGLGKSSYIRSAIQNALLNNKGLIVVTDNLNGLNSLIHESRDDNAEIISYFNANSDRIALLSASNIHDELPYLFGKNAKPVILMTTQRYFSMNREQILQLTSGTIKRETILFDEKPYFVISREIGEKQLNDVDTALRQAIDDTALPHNKLFLLEQWKVVMQNVRRLFTQYENRNNTPENNFWHDTRDNMTDNDERFLHLINVTYRDKLDRYNVNVRNYIQAVMQMYSEGATFNSKKRLKNKAKDREYRNSFTVMVDNSEMLLNVGAKVFVFDGTADINPEYDLDYINLIDCSNYKRQLPNLTINIIDVATAKHRLVGKQNEDYVNAIVKDIHSRYGDIVVFSHKDLKNQLGKEFERVDYFGNIKGKNNYKDVTDVVQIGYFRFPDIAYELETCFLMLFTSDENPKRMIRVIGQTAVNKTRNRIILSDIEQNLFRSKIRNVDCKESVSFNIYMSAYKIDESTGETVYNDLVEMIIDRYETLGATVNIIKTPTEFRVLKTKSRKTTSPTYAQKILDWLAMNKGNTFKLKDMLSDLNISNKRFDKIKQTNKGISELFFKMSKADNRKGYYKVL